DRSAARTANGCGASLIGSPSRRSSDRSKSRTKWPNATGEREDMARLEAILSERSGRSPRFLRVRSLMTRRSRLTTRAEGRMRKKRWGAIVLAWAVVGGCKSNSASTPAAPTTNVLQIAGVYAITQRAVTDTCGQTGSPAAVNATVSHSAAGAEFSMADT